MIDKDKVVDLAKAYVDCTFNKEITNELLKERDLLLIQLKEALNPPLFIEETMEKETSFKITILEPEELKFLNVDRFFDEQAKDIFITLLKFSMYRGKYQIEEKVRYFSDSFSGEVNQRIETSLEF